jgi:predicted nucleic acid-binding Zn ribbon protein
MKPPETEPRAVAAVLDRVLQRVDPEQGLRAYAIWTFWNAEVGETIARRAQPARVRNGVLFVTVATHTWLQELRFLKEQLRARLNARLGAELVRDIVFITGAIEEPSRAAAPRAAPTASCPAPIDLPPIADPELAGVFRRVVQARARRISRRVKRDT